MEIIQPKMLIVSAPSGAGKTTIIHQAIKAIPELVLSVSHTSRPPRKGEIEGVDYFFLTTEEFRQKIERNEFLEWAEVHGNYYGTSIDEIKKRIQAGKTVVLDIDVQGAQQIRKISELHPVYVFIVPPSLEELKRRLEIRETESKESLQRRIKNAEKEMTYKDSYDFLIVNDQLDKAVKEFIDILNNDSYNRSTC
jgi:guanylate kinase